MDLSEYSVWYFLVQLGIIFIAVLAGNTLRRKIKWIRNTLLPSSVIAGILVFILKFIPFINEFIHAKFMETLTYHCLGLGFIALTFKSGVKSKDKNRFAVLDTGITTVNGYLVQGIIGLGLTIVLSITIFKDLFYASGLLLPMGYGQGTGQALNIGNVWINDSTFGNLEMILL